MEEHTTHYYQASGPDAADKEIILQTDMSVDIHGILCAMAHNELLNYAFAIAKAPIRQLMLRNVVQRMREPEMAFKCLHHYEDLYNHIRDRDREKSLAAIKLIMNINDSDFAPPA